MSETEMRYVIAETVTEYSVDVIKNDEGPLAATLSIVSEPFETQDEAAEFVEESDHLPAEHHTVVAIQINPDRCEFIDSDTRELP